MFSQEAPVSKGSVDPNDFAAELEAAAANHKVGTRLWFENHRVRVWEVSLELGQRAPFHAHVNDFWTVVDSGRGLQRRSDGEFVVCDYEAGETLFLENTPVKPLIHDLENIGETTLRFMTVELL